MELTAEDIRTQVDRLVNSKTFETSEVHRRLLQYLTDKAIKGEADRLKEYTIALEVFGKPPSYDPKHDSIVRLQVGRLRQKLLAYYQSEAQGDTIVVTLPKGAYKLAFEDASTKKPPEPLEVVAQPPPIWTKAWMMSAVIGIVTLWAITATVLAVRSNRETAVVRAQWNPALEKIWAPFLETNRPVVVCLGIPMFVRIPDFGFFRDPRTNDWQEIAKSERVSTVLKELNARDTLPWYAFTGAGEANAAVLVSKLLGTRKRELQFTRSNLLSWQQVADSDVVFIGPPKFNVQLQSAALKQDIVVEATGIRNLKPKPGEPVFLEDAFMNGKSSTGVTHALISRTAGLSNNGELLVIAGNGSADTLGAAEWLTQQTKATQLVNKLRDAHGNLPRHFQAVFKVEFQQGIPVRSSYVFHHALTQ